MRRAAAAALLAGSIATGLSLAAAPASAAVTPIGTVDGHRAFGIGPHSSAEQCAPTANRLTSFGTSSAHAATMMAVAVAFLFYHRPLGYAWLAVALVTGYSRVYVGVHYPYQVLLGWLIGAFVAFVAVKSWQAVERVRAARAGEAASQGAGQ